MRNISPQERDIRRIAETVHLLGRNRSGTVTLEADVATTSVTDPTITAETAVLLIPMTANAAAAAAASPWVLATPSRGSFEIAHDNNSQTDRTFRWVALGD